MAYTYHDVRRAAMTKVNSRDAALGMHHLNAALDRMWNFHDLPGTTADISEFYLERGIRIYPGPFVELFSDQTNLLQAKLVRFDTDGTFREDELEPVAFMRSDNQTGFPTAIHFNIKDQQYELDAIPLPDPLKWYVKGVYKKRVPRITNTNETDNLFSDTFYFELVKMVIAEYRDSREMRVEALNDCLAKMPTAFGTTPIEEAGSGFVFD